MTITLVIITIFCALSLKILSLLYEHFLLRKKLMLIPGPWSIPLLGSVFTSLLFSKDEMFRLLWKEAEKYKNGMFVIWYANQPTLHLKKPHQMEVILKSQTLLTKSSTYNYLCDWLGNGLVTSTGDVWRRHRRLLTPAFHFAVLDQFTEVIFDKVNILNASIKLIVDENPSKPINFFGMAIKCTLDAVCKTVMGIDLDVQREKKENEYVEALHSFANLSTERFFCFWLWPDFIFDLTSRGRSYRHSIQTMHEFTSKVINEKMKMRKASVDKNNITKNAEDNEYNNVKPFLDLLIDLSEADESPLSLEEIREQVDTFMFAAHDTTGIAISYVLFCLGNAQEAQMKVYNEINEVIGSSNHKAPTKQQLAQLKYLERVIKESLRIFPSAPYFSRALTQDVVIDGHLIPKGIEVYMQIMQMHRDPDIWDDPVKFDPDRFLPENIAGRHPYAYIPFSAGPRNCIGQKFAMFLMKIALANILRQWIVHSDTAIKDLKLTTQFVLTPPNQILNLRFEPRF